MPLCHRSGKDAVQVPGGLIAGQPLLEDPQHAGVLAQRDPVVALDMGGGGVLALADAMPPAALDPVRAGEQVQRALVQRPVARAWPASSGCGRIQVGWGVGGAW